MATSFDSTRGTPEKPSDKLREVLAGWIDTVATQGEKALDSLGFRGPGGAWSPPVDVLESKDQILVYVDLPGVDPAKIETVLVGNMLTIKGELPDVVTFAGCHPHRRERAAGAFSRSIPLPVAVNPAARPPRAARQSALEIKDWAPGELRNSGIACRSR